MDTQIQLTLPDEVELGVHADFARVWHTEEAFVLDFAAVTGPFQPGEDETGNPVTMVDARVAARVRLAPTHVFELMKALEQQLSQWEAETGNTPGGPSETLLD